MVAVFSHLALEQQGNDTMSTFWCDLYSSQNLILSHIWLQPRHWLFWKKSKYEHPEAFLFSKNFQLMQVEKLSI